MGREIVYCHACAKQLSGREFESGSAVKSGDLVYCRGCAPEAPAPSLPSTTRRIRTARSAARGSEGGRGALYGGLAAGGVGLLLLVLVLAGGGKPARQEETRPPAPPPEPPKRAVAAPPARSETEAKAAEALEWARNFRKNNPADAEGQLRAFDLALKAAERTPLHEEARRERERCAADAKARARMVDALDRPAGGLAGWWKLDEGSGEEAKDASGMARAGRLQGAEWTAGRSGKALRFGDAAAFVKLELPDLPPPWTASMWVKREDSPEVASTLLDSKAFSLRLEQFERTKKLGVTAYGKADLNFEAEAPVGTWAHLVFVGGAADIALFVDGVRKGTVASAIDLPLASIGSSESRVKHSFRGAIDEIRVYRRALTDEEIRFLSRP